MGDINKFITLQSKSGMPAKDYQYFQEVIDLLFPILNKENIKIIHLGQDSPPLNGVLNLNNQTSIGQAAYIIKKSLCHLSVDSWSCHFAGAEEIPLVSLYGSTTVENHSPYHYNPEKSIFLESHRNGNKASFQREENPKTVNFINPEDIAAAVSRLLKLDWNYNYKTVKIGANYQNKIIESDCSNIINTQQMGLQNLILRLDYNEHPNYAIMMEQAKFCKLSLIVSQVVPINLLQQIKPQIQEVLVEINENHNPLFCKELLDSKIPFRMISFLDDEKLNALKLDYIDLPGVIFKQNTQIPPELKDKDLNKIHYKSSKLTISGNSFFQSKYDIINKRPCDPNNVQPQQLINNSHINKLWMESDYLIFLEKVIDN